MEDKLVEGKLPCPDTKGCGSSDAAHLYTDGLYCFSCGEMWGPGTEEFDSLMGNENLKDNKVDTEIIENKQEKVSTKKKQKFPWDQAVTKSWADRKISASVMDFYGVKTYRNSIAFPFLHNGNIVGSKIRRKDTKDMWSDGQVNTCLWGQHLFKGKGKKLVITEGEIDALSVAEANFRHYSKIYPTVSMGSCTNTKLLIENIEFINQFDEVVLWIDNDPAGEKPLKDAIKIIGYHKARVAQNKYKDANETLVDAGPGEVRNTVWNAVEKRPGSIIKGTDTWKQFQENKNMTVIPWPEFLDKLNNMCYGRWLKSITVIGAGTGVGKSTFLKEDVFHIISNTDYKYGVCFLEESIGETVSDLISIQLNKRVGLPDTEVTEEEEKGAWEVLFGDDRIMMVDHQGSVSDDSLIEKLEYMMHCGCQLVILDHVTIAISEDTKHQNQALDSFMSSLLKLVKRHDAWVGVVSHLRKVGTNETSFESGGIITEDDLKGSGSLKQISFQTLALSRNKSAEDDTERDTTKLYLLKDRKTGETGYAGQVRYNRQTGRLYNPEDVDDEQFGVVDFEEEGENE